MGKKIPENKNIGRHEQREVEAVHVDRRDERGDRLDELPQAETDREQVEDGLEEVGEDVHPPGVAVAREVRRSSCDGSNPKTSSVPPARSAGSRCEAARCSWP